MKWLSEYQIKMENTSILSIKDGDGDLLIQSTTQKPLIQGNSIAGGLRALLSETYECDIIEKMFGSSKDETDFGKSKITISDAHGAYLQTESRTHVKIDSALGIVDVKNNRGQLMTQSFLVPNIEFEWQLKIEADSKEEIELYETMVNQGLASIQQNLIKFGSKKTSGAGAFKINEVKKRKIELTNPKSLIGYLKNELPFDKLDMVLFDQFQPVSHEVFSVGLCTASPLLIGGNSYYDSEKPDRMNIKNGRGKYIIPGSSLKGVFRQHCDKLSIYFHCPEIVNELFGSDNDDIQTAGRVYFDDLIMKNVNDKIISNRIHIDRFTGGVMEGALVSELPIVGTCDLKIIMHALPDKDKNNKAVGLILLALKDLADGSLTLGSGYAIGRGRFSGKVIKHNDTIAIDFEKNDNTYALEYVKKLNTQEGRV
ncbi:RAMP superfamily CRISPR-associated protein [Fusibacter sp. 3D3]|uniref:RAMP superfamily CRISPR-associated protein n=1 Tax=Fusibacter sp. 3D3 TaxID=1048380 RepID=UPI000852A3FF|nr:RAMP superfamily CRISPR-associated protein [Fusibacter sp. 3D3]GAU79969.1 DUF324 domain-containing protein [Fusibacter sp. 3D3]